MTRALRQLLFVSALSLVLSAAALAEAPAPIRGFTADGSAAQRAIERELLESGAADSIRAFHRELTREPHPAGSARTKEVAEYIAAQWRAQGLDAVRIHRYDVLSSSPRSVQVEMLKPERYTPTLREDPIPQDPDSANPAISGAWTSFSASGDVTAPVVYANSGNPSDYAVLRANGIDPRGKIVVVRYSNPYSYRGFKALTAEREGAAAMIVYSDPQQDGYAKGKVFPEGPWGPDSHLQRGGAAYDYIVPGDPLTPGWASVADAKRIEAKDAVSVPRIVVLPMSHRDIAPILAKLGGPDAPDSWQGALPIRYHLGGADVTLHVKVDMQTDVQPNYVVEGRITGAARPDEWVVLGNHHDAWVFGGVDPSSGTAAMLELTRTLGAMAKHGQRPRRTLVFGAWDGEEVTLTGSTEWGEEFRDELRRKAVAYLNVDSAASGSQLEVAAVGSLAPAIVELTGELASPAGGTLREAFLANRDGGTGIIAGARKPGELVVTRIGSGSDHTVFINHVGLPVADLTFNGPYGVYHSAYDSHTWVATIGDPGFRYTRAMTGLWGSLGLRLGNAELLPLDVAAYAQSIAGFVQQLDEIPQAAYRLDTRELQAAVQRLSEAGTRLNSAMTQALARGKIPSRKADAVNRELRAIEQTWLHEPGIPGRAWFKHLLYAPRYTYAAMSLPGVTEAAEDADWDRARAQLALLKQKCDENTARVDRMIRLL